MSEFRHYLLTRFNVRLNWTDMKPTDEWLKRRLALFEQFCYPSVKGQSCQTFDWIVFFDSNSPQFLLDRIEDYRKWPRFRPQLVDTFDSLVVSQTITDIMPSNVEYVITSRLDNDDALCRDYIQLVQSQFNDQELLFVNFLDGYTYHDGRLYKFKFQRNSFINLIEKRRTTEDKEFITVLCGVSHRELHDIAAIENVTSKPAWMMVIHEDNIANVAQGTRRPSHCVRDTFCLGDVHFRGAIDFRCEQVNQAFKAIRYRIRRRLPRA